MAGTIEVITTPGPGFIRQGRPFGFVFPPRPDVGLPSLDARTIALRTFARFLASLVFRLPGVKDSGTTIPFRVPLKNIHIEQPDNVTELDFPSIAFIPARATYDYFNLGPARIIDSTIDVFAPGTALVTPGDYVENFTLEIWGSKKGERRAIIAGIEAAMLNEETSTATRFVLPEYFNVPASFELNDRELFDEPDAVRNRRRAHLYIELRVCVAQLVNMNPLVTYVLVQTDVDC